MIKRGIDLAPIKREPQFIKLSEKLMPELDPFLKGIRDKTAPGYSQFQKNLDSWSKTFIEALKAENMLSALGILHFRLTKVKLSLEDRQALALVSLFSYQGMVETLGVSLVDVLILLLIANGRALHVERIHNVPRMVHAVDLEDLNPLNVSLGAKLNFLDRNRIRTSEFIDRKLRNDIAHLRFTVDDEGKIFVKRRGKRKEVNIYGKINKLKTYFITINYILSTQTKDS